MPQKLSWKEINGVPQNLLSSPSQSPSKSSKSKQNYEIVTNNFSNNQKIKSVKQVVSVKCKNSAQAKIFKVYPYQYKKTEALISQNKEAKAFPKTERHKLKFSNDKLLKKENVAQFIDTNTLHTARDFHMSDQCRNLEGYTGLNDNSSTHKWTMKSRENDKTTSKNKHIDDFEKLFYQSMTNDKSKVVSQKGVDFSQIKSFKAAGPSHYRSLSKSKSSKHVKSK